MMIISVLKKCKHSSKVRKLKVHKVSETQGLIVIKFRSKNIFVETQNFASFCFGDAHFEGFSFEVRKELYFKTTSV